MTFQGRSLDDLPLAAYSTGVKPDELEAPPPEEHHLSQQEAMAQALGVELPPREGGEAAPGRRGPSLPRLPRLARPRLPRPRLPRLALGSAGSSAPAMTRAVSLADLPAPARASDTFAAHSDSFAVAAEPAAALRSGPLGALGRADLGGLVRNPRATVRDPRVLFGALIAVGVVLLVVSLLPGAGAGGLGGPGSSPTAPVAIAPTPAPPGNATAEVTGKVGGTFALAGVTGSGAAVNGRIDATWSGATGAMLGISGPAYGGVRTTDAGLILTWTYVVNGVPVTFTSDAAECTIGMADAMKNVTGSFVCKKLKSDDGKLVVDVRGTYRT